jgi:hypothetical protein
MNQYQRGALRLIAHSGGRDGLTTVLLMALGCDADTLSSLVRAGLVTEAIRRDEIDDKTVEVTRLTITEAGRRALTAN